MDTDKEIISDNLYEAMYRKGWTIKRLSEESGVAVNTLNRILSGKYSTRVDTLILLARTMNIDVKVFFSGIITTK